MRTFYKVALVATLFILGGCAATTEINKYDDGVLSVIVSEPVNLFQDRITESPLFKCTKNKCTIVKKEDVK